MIIKKLIILVLLSTTYGALSAATHCICDTAPPGYNDGYRCHTHCVDGTMFYGKAKWSGPRKCKNAEVQARRACNADSIGSTIYSTSDCKCH